MGPDIPPGSLAKGSLELVGLGSDSWGSEKNGESPTGSMGFTRGGDMVQKWKSILDPWCILVSELSGVQKPCVDMCCGFILIEKDSLFMDCDYP